MTGPRRRKRGTITPPEPRVLGREAFARISEVEGIHLSEEAKEMFAEFDRQGLSPEERRRAIADRFKGKVAE